MPKPPTREREPIVLWWMPLLALVAPLAFAAWRAAATETDALTAFLEAIVWPGVALYLGTLALLWAGWKIELE